MGNGQIRHATGAGRRTIRIAAAWLSPLGTGLDRLLDRLEGRS